MFLEVFAGAVTVRVTRACYWLGMPTVFFWEDKHLGLTPLKEGAQLLQQFGKSLTLQLVVCWPSRKKETPINRARDIKWTNPSRGKSWVCTTA